MDHRLVVSEAHRGRAQGVLHSRESARWSGNRELRPAAARHQDPTQGHQGRLTSLRAQLLPPLPAGSSACRTRRHLDEPCWISLHHTGKGKPSMSEKWDGRNSGALGRRGVLLGTTTAAAGAILASPAQAQTNTPARPMTAASGTKPNIVMIV